MLRRSKKRNHPVKVVTLPPAIIAKVAARAAAEKSSFSRELARYVERAEGNDHRLGFAIRGELVKVQLAMEELREAHCGPKVDQAVRTVERVRVAIVALLAPSSDEKRGHFSDFANPASIHSISSAVSVFP